jgi:uncharacterized protein YndB with AHSA1/START domain
MLYAPSDKEDSDMVRFRIAILAGLAASSPLAAEVKSATAAGFEIENKAVVAATPSETYAMLGRPGLWWSSAHTYSGDAANMSLKLKAGGCFCEKVPAGGGTIEHGRVIHARPGATLRLQGGLGPLQAEAALGTLTWTLKAVAGGTEVTQSYVVGGYIRGGADKLAPLVDQVLAEQLAGLQRRLAR